MREPIFIAANTAEAKFIESLLDAEGIEYEIAPEPFVRTPLGGACAMGLMFEVLGGQADYCRKLIERAGLGRGVIERE